MTEKYLRLFKKDVRHVICAIITLISTIAAFLFPNSLARIAESIRDVFTSLAYYFIEVYTREHNPVPATITELPKWKLTEEIWEPISFLPSSWEEFQSFWEVYFELLFNQNNIDRYWSAVADFLYYGSRVIITILPLILVIMMILDNTKYEINLKRGAKTLTLIKFEQFLFKKIYPVLSWIKNFIQFCKDNPIYYRTWVMLWAIHFNVFAIAISIIAFYFYFAATWDIFGLYTQFLKLQIDLTPMIRFIPGIVWLLIFVVVYNYVCRSMAFQRLYYAESANRAFLRERGVVSVVYGAMGTGKTQLITSMARSAEIEQFDMAFDIMVEQDIKFPNFPWQNFVDQIKKEIDQRNIVDLPSCRRWVATHKDSFQKIKNEFSSVEWRRVVRKHKDIYDPTFGYDYDHYKLIHNDELQLYDLFEALESYACAYLIFSVKTTLLFSNYSIRLDSIIHDIGNMPYRDNDFFNKSPEYQEAYSRHAHIIDFDMLRLGKKVIENNPNALRLSFGVYVITEIDKERKNTLELKETKINIDEANQKNDLFNANLKMSRHAAVVANRVFMRIICDLQRPEDWGAGGRDVGEVIFIADHDEMAPVLPFCSSYWLFEGLYARYKTWWDEYDRIKNYNRSDLFLFYYVVKNITAFINAHYERLNNLFGMQTLLLEIQTGNLEGSTKTDKWRIMPKKDRSRVYKTACLESVFDSYEPNKMHVDDYLSYSGEIGTAEENLKQNSFFQMDILKMRGINSKKDE